MNEQYTSHDGEYYSTEEEIKELREYDMCQMYDFFLKKAVDFSHKEECINYFKRR